MSTSTDASKDGAEGKKAIIRISVLISGSGTNLQALIDAASSGTLTDCSFVRVISNRKSAYGLTRASEAGIPTHYHNLVGYKKSHPATDEGIAAARREYDEALASLVLGDSPDLVVLAGFMHILSPEFLNPLSSREVAVINLHPSLPGTYLGANALERAHKDWIDGKIDRTGLMIHYVIAEVDEGEPVLTEEVVFDQALGDNDLAKFEERFHRVEWKAIVKGTDLVAEVLRKERLHGREQR